MKSLKKALCDLCDLYTKSVTLQDMSLNEGHEQARRLGQLRRGSGNTGSPCLRRQRCWQLSPRGWLGYPLHKSICSERSICSEEQPQNLTHPRVAPSFLFLTEKTKKQKTKPFCFSSFLRNELASEDRKFFLKNNLLFISCIYTYMYKHMSAGTLGAQRRALDSLELELQAVENRLTGGSELGLPLQAQSAKCLSQEPEGLTLDPQHSHKKLPCPSVNPVPGR